MLALRVDFPVEDADEPTTSGDGRFDLRSFAEAIPDYRFPFDTPPHDRTYFENHLQALARYYRIVSEGRVEIDFEVFPKGLEEAYTLSNSELSYGNGRSEAEIGEKWIQLFRDAVELADADPEGPRFADFNSFLVFHAGVGHETGELNDIRSVFLTEADMSRYAGGPILADEGEFEIEEGWILPESPSQRGVAGLNGLMAKFFGHQLGLPGLSNFADGLPGVGGWSLMDVGANALGFVLQDSLMPVVGFAPPHPMAWTKARLGWIEPLVVQRDTTVALLATDRDGDLPKAVRVPIDGEEYFLLENRQQRGNRGLPEGVESLMLDPEYLVWIEPEQIGFSNGDGTGTWLEVEEYDAFIPGSGLLIWHVDDGVIREKIGTGAINNDPAHPGISLEEADGYRDIGNPVFDRLSRIEGSPQDPFFAGGQTEFGADTWPDTRSYRGWPSGIRIEVLSAPGDTMLVRVRFPRLRAGWPQEVVGGRRLQAADVDGDGVAELLVEESVGVRVVRVETGFELWQVGGARLLAAADVDGDGQAEIFVWRDGEVSAWKIGEERPEWTFALDGAVSNGLVSVEIGLFAGTPLLVLAGEELVLLEARSGELLHRVLSEVSGMTAADVDGDGTRELIVARKDGLWRLTDNGLESLWAGDGELLPGPVAGDLDGDGRAEVVIAEVEGVVRVVGERGERFAVDLGDSLRTGPVLGDVDGDGFLEIVLAGTDQVHALRENGLQQANFPAYLARTAGIGTVEHPPILLDLDGDGKQEVFLGTRRGLFGIDDDGQMLAGFPLLTAGAVSFSPVGGDLDGDGQLEVAALGGDWLYAWEPGDFSPSYSGRVAGWGQAGFSAAGVRAHTGLVDEVKPESGIGILPQERVYCYPNPVEGVDEVRLRFFLNRPARLRLEVFDAIGARVERREVSEGMTAPAENEIVWSVGEYESGLYICRLEARGEGGEKEVVFVRMAVSR